MSILSTDQIAMPDTIADGIWEKAQYGSILGQLTQAKPMKFGTVKQMVFDEMPRAQYVGAGKPKAGSEATYRVKTIEPQKVQVTVRYDEEVQWADNDHQLGVLKHLAGVCGRALGRAVDLGVFHGINPNTGEAYSGIAENLSQTTHTVEIADQPDREIEAAQGLVISSGNIPTGAALDPLFAWNLATQRDSVGRKLYPELGLNLTAGAFNGMVTSVSTTVSGQPEMADSKIRAFVGNWDAIRWGVQKLVQIEKIPYGNPDQKGDLKGNNQIALRAEIVYGFGILDMDAFAKLTLPAGP